MEFDVFDVILATILFVCRGSLESFAEEEAHSGIMSPSPKPKFCPYEICVLSSVSTRSLLREVERAGGPATENPLDPSLPAGELRKAAKSKVGDMVKRGEKRAVVSVSLRQKI